MNYTDLQAAIGRVQLKRQGEFHKTRLAIASRYQEKLSTLNPRINFQMGLTDPMHARHLFVILWPAEKMRLNRDEVFIELRRRNIGVSIHYYPLHKMHLYDASAQPPLPVTDSICHRILTLPISSSMMVEDADFVLDNLSELAAA